MMRRCRLVIAAVVGSLCFAAYSGRADARVVRATQMTRELWSQFEKGEFDNLVVEFRQGDQLPVSLRAEGDLFETTEVQKNHITIRKPFWVKLLQQEILLSLDGTEFKKIENLVSGSLTAGFSTEGGGSLVNGVGLLFKAFLK